MSVLDGCHVIIFEIHCVLGEYLLVFSVLQWCEEEGLLAGENLCVVDFCALLSPWLQKLNVTHCTGEEDP